MGAFLMEMTQTLMLLTTPHRLQTKKQKKNNAAKVFLTLFVPPGARTAQIQQVLFKHKCIKFNAH